VTGRDRRTTGNSRRSHGSADLAATDRIRARVGRFPLARATEAYDLLRAGKINGRAVIVPRGSAA
jgi:D-arabinose 1-dehydrogenase-like Zn-dependent alcohol dehydrogenase